MSRALRLSNLLDPAVQHTPEKTCAVLMEERKSLSYSQARQVLGTHKDWLQDEIRAIASTGELVIVAYLSNNTLDFVLSVLACTSEAIPGLPALLNVRWTAKEMTAALQLDQTIGKKDATTLLLYGPEWKETATRAQRLARSTVIVRPIPDFCQNTVQAGYGDYSEIHDSLYARRRDCDDGNKLLSSASNYSHEDALIVFTSGTSSGRPKGARLSHAAIAIQAAAKCDSPCHYSCQTALLASTVPFFHIGGLSSLLAVWGTGGRLVLSDGSFKPAKVWEAIETPCSVSSRLVNTLVLVPAMLFAMQEDYKERRNTLEMLSYPLVDLVLVGGQSISDAQKDFIRAVFPNACVVQTYACTEAASSLTFYSVLTSHVPQPPIAGDCVGRPPSHVTLSLMDQHLWTEKSRLQSISKPFTTGVIATRGPHVMKGYWQRGKKSSIGIAPQGWLVTNDLGFFDEQGRLYFSGRVNDTIRTGGETVLATEVERVIKKHPAAAECAVFPLPDDRFGQAVSCAVVLEHKQQGLTLLDLREWCRGQDLSGFKCPRHMFLVATLPKNSSGKVLKFRLIEKFHTPMRSKL